MLDLLRTLSGTPVPGLLMGLGVLLLLLSAIDRRAVATIGSVLLVLGVGIAFAPHAARSPGPATADSAPSDTTLKGQPPGGDAPNPPSSRDQVSINHLSADAVESAAVGTDSVETGCSTRFDVPKREGTAPSSDRDKEPSYGGFLGNLMPSVSLLPCATRRFESRPLTPRSVAEGSGRPEASARRVLAEAGFAGLERTYGGECPRAIRVREIPLARVRVLRFNMLEAARAWAALPSDAHAGALSVSQQDARRTAWFKRSCGDAPAAVFWQEDRAGNVVVAITIYTSPDSLEDRSVMDYARVLAEDIIGKIMPPAMDTSTPGFD